MNGIIVKGVGGLYTIKTETGAEECKARGLFRKKHLTPMVGDYVEIEKGIITNVFSRKNSLLRPPCANIDKLFIVIALDEPEPNIYTLDKMITIAYYHNIEPILIFNKTDLHDVLGIVEIYNSMPIKKFCLCATDATDVAIQALKNEIQGCTVALCGLSGVGKSTIMNLLDITLSVEIGEISERLQRGKHTTRHVELFELFGGMIMDTPGFSNLLFEYFDIKDRSVLENCFPEFKPFLGNCRFADCAHVKEPDCFVIQNVENGQINKSRYESYTKMYEEIGTLKKWENK